MFPIQLQAAGKTALIVGAGNVGSRKADAWFAQGGSVRIVDPKPIGESGVRVERIAAPFDPKHLDGVAVAFACATDSVNARVTAEAKARGIWVCDAILPERGDFILPAILERGPLTFTVCTSGTAPALAKRLRDRLALNFDESYGEWATILGELRPQIQSTVADPEIRREIFRELTEITWLDRLKQVGPLATRSEMLQLLTRWAEG
jgi:siroheme synthase-like protein